MAKNIRKFSNLITESGNKHSEIMELVNKLGYSSIEEIKKEKSILSKLEALLKELPGTENVSEDDADDIKKEILKKGEPKSLEDKEGEKEDNEVSDSDGEVSEDDAKDIEADIVNKGEPTELDDDEELLDDEDVKEIPSSANDKGAGTEVPKKRILSFDEFVTGNSNPTGYPQPQGRSDDLEEEITINKNVNYRDDDEEEEDYAEPIAASVKTDKGESVNEAARVPSNILDFAKRKGSYATALVKKAATWAEKAGKRISGGTAIGKNYSTIVLDMKHQGSEIYINLDKETIELFGEEVTDAKSFARVLAANQDSTITESKINNAKEFEEYAMEILKSAHGEDFDEEIATKVVNDLKSKYGEDWGAMIGALQSGMGN